MVELLENTLFSKFINYLSVLAKTKEGTTYLLDATNPYLPYNRLPEYCLNSFAVLGGSEKDVKWININTVPLSNKNCFSIMNYNLETNTFEGQTRLTSTLYWSKQYQNALDEKKTEGLLNKSKDFFGKKNKKNRKPFFKAKAFQTFPNIKNETETNYRFSNIKTIVPTPPSSPYVINTNVKFKPEKVGKRLFISPLLMNTLAKNPLTKKDRNSPIDFNFPFSNAVTTIIKTPQGYSVEFIPKDKIITLPENFGSASFTYNENNNNIQVSYKFDMNKMVIPASAYTKLKQFFDDLVQQHHEQIIFKQNN